MIHASIIVPAVQIQVIGMAFGSPGVRKNIRLRMAPISMKTPLIVARIQILFEKYLGSGFNEFSIVSNKIKVLS